MFDLDFTPDELATNRQGMLSAAQRARLDSLIYLQKRNARNTLIFFGGFGVFLFVFGGAVELNNVQGNWKHLLTGQNLLAVGFVVGFFIVVSIFGAFSQMTILKPLQRGDIRRAEGRAQIIVGRVRGFSTYSVKLRRGTFGGTVFRFTSAASLAHFVEGQLYRIYYLPYVTPVPLSTEPLPAPMHDLSHPS